MINIIDKSQCCGCTACASACPKDAIEMRPDGMGFLYPFADESKCVNCGKCEKVCSFNDHYDTRLNLPRPDVYGARHKDIHEVETSRSGAAFIAISDYIFKHGGVVYGVGYKDHFYVAHKRATTKEERDEFKGSKYVQSDLRGIFRQVRRDLLDGMTVLFSGTPCQTSGLNAYIGKKLRQNLFLVDVPCYGVPGPYLWRDFLSYIEKKQGDKVCRVNFRDKQRFGWNAPPHETFKFVNSGGGKDKVIAFKYVFYHYIMFRRSCGVCHFANTKRPSDITIGDFWGWQNTNPKFNEDNKGVSLVLINTEKGRGMFDAIKDELYYFPAVLENALQPVLCKPTDIHPRRDAFEEDYLRHGFEHAMKKFGRLGWKYYYYIFKNQIKNMIKGTKNK